MRNFKHLLSGLLAFASLTALNSCMSTETLEPEIEKDTALVLNLKAPEEAKTRADDSHKLRFTAKLYKNSPINIQEKDLIRQEIIDGDLSGEGVANQIIFDVPNGLYTIFVYGDYIPKDAQKNEKNFFDDYYYDTSKKDYVQIRTTPGKDDAVLSESFFNNDNYDFFYGIFTVEKTDLKVVKNMELKRAVARISLVDIGTNTGKLDLSISKLDLYTWYVMADGEGVGYAGTSREFTPNPNINLSKDLLGNGEQELFYYYTFASKDLTTKQTRALSLTAKAANMEDKTFEITGIAINQNYKTLVKGSFYPDKQGSAAPENGPIYLNISITDWLGELSSYWGVGN